MDECDACVRDYPTDIERRQSHYSGIGCCRCYASEHWTDNWYVRQRCPCSCSRYSSLMGYLLQRTKRRDAIGLRCRSRIRRHLCLVGRHVDDEHTDFALRCLGNHLLEVSSYAFKDADSHISECSTNISCTRDELVLNRQPRVVDLIECAHIWLRNLIIDGGLIVDGRCRLLTLDLLHLLLNRESSSFLILNAFLTIRRLRVDRIKLRLQCLQFIRIFLRVNSCDLVCAGKFGYRTC